MEIAVSFRNDAAYNDVCRKLRLCIGSTCRRYARNKNVITIGDIQAFIQYVKNFTQPIQQIAQVINMVQSMSAASERVLNFLTKTRRNR